MEVFRDLYLHGDAAQLAALVDAIERSLPEDWTRDKATEEGLVVIGYSSDAKSLEVPGYTAKIVKTSEAGKTLTRELGAEQGETRGDVHTGRHCTPPRC